MCVWWYGCGRVGWWFVELYVWDGESWCSCVCGICVVSSVGGLMYVLCDRWW